jgi:hypothetical protein
LSKRLVAAGVRIYFSVSTSPQSHEPGTDLLESWGTDRCNRGRRSCRNLYKFLHSLICMPESLQGLKGDPSTQSGTLLLLESISTSPQPNYAASLRGLVGIHRRNLKPCCCPSPYLLLRSHTSLLLDSETNYAPSLRSLVGILVGIFHCNLEPCCCPRPYLLLRSHFYAS